MSDEEERVREKYEKVHRNKINQRKGHRSYVTRVMDNTKELLFRFSESERDRLSGLRVVIVEKMSVLKDLDEDILCGLSEEGEIEIEVVRSSELRADMQELIAKIESKLKIVDVSDRSRSSSVTTATKVQNITRLPKLSLQSFSGNPLEFQSFWDSFNAAVHNNSRLEDITKFNYLKSFLKGQALAAIHGLSLTSENYTEAIEIIHNRFGNKQLLITSNIYQSLSIPAAHSINHVKKIREVYDKIETHVRNLKSLDIDTKQYGPVLVSITMSKLPNEIKLVISRSMPINDEWKIDELLEILRREIVSREMCFHLTTSSNAAYESSWSDNSNGEDEQFTQCLYAGNSYDNNKRSTSHNRKIIYEGAHSYNNENKITCTYCRRNHQSSRCDVITDIKGIKSIFRNKAKCFICLKSGHIARHCKSTMKCFRCQQRHHISICEQSNQRGGEQSQMEQPRNNYTGVTASKQNCTLLQSAQAKIVSRNGRSEQARVLFDSCSQKSFINESLSHKLNLPIVRKERIILKAFESQKEKLGTLDVVQARVFCINQPDFVEVELFVVTKICSPISCQEIELAQATYEHLVELKLADSTNGSSESEIDVLIGGDSYWCFMTGEMKRGRDGPVALKTILGWVLSGAYHNDSIQLARMLCRVTF